MPDNGRFSEEEIEERLRDLGARVEYPPTPDVASTVHLRLDEEEQPQEASRNLRWPPFLAPRWAAVAAALVVICVVALSPTLRTTLSGPFAPQAGSEAGSAAKPESGVSGAGEGTLCSRAFFSVASSAPPDTTAKGPGST